VQLLDPKFGKIRGLWIYCHALVKQTPESPNEVHNRLVEKILLSFLTPHNPVNYNENNETKIVDFLKRNANGHILVPCTHYRMYDYIKNRRARDRFINHQLKARRPLVIQRLYEIADRYAKKESRIALTEILLHGMTPSLEERIPILV